MAKKDKRHFEQLFSGTGKEADYAEFLSLHDPKVQPTGKIHMDVDGFDLILNNPYEKRLATSLLSSGYALDVHGQTFPLPYRKPWASHPSPYYPDLILYTHDRRIAFLEIKSILGMCQDETIAKYLTLVAFCKKRGYRYAMIDVDEVSFEEYLFPGGNPKVAEVFQRSLDLSGAFTTSDLDALLAKTPPSKQSQTKRDIASLVLRDAHIENRYCHDSPHLINAVKVPYSLPYKQFDI